MLDKETEKLIRLSKGSAFRAFGFGVNSLDFARAQLNLQENDPVNYRLFTDIADRILFVDHLRFELWQALESSDGGFGDSLRLITNLDSLETYLLCTCIDALAGGRDFVTFADWVQENQEKVAEQLGGKAVTSTNEFSSITANLHDSYTSEEVGLTRKFTAFFQELPEFLKQALAQNIVLIKGDYWSHNAKQKMQKWQNLSVDDQVKKIAGEYLYSVRRSKYTHAVKKHEAAGGFWKHLSQTPFEPNGWTPIRLKSSKNPDKVKLTILTSNTIEESYLLRAIISYHVLTNLLGYSVSDNYLEQFHKYYEALMEIHNFLREMQKSMEYLDFLLTPQANLDAAETYKDDPVRTFPESPAEKLLNKYTLNNNGVDYES